ncbi:MAG: alkaline phosphatase family protein [Halobacteriales archaeon]|nr:alkaline phosphatase family protein [Halobacteriales archaeon]
MIRTAIETRLRDSGAGTPDWGVSPAYGDYCFAGIPHTVAGWLGVDTGPDLPPDVIPAADFTPEIVLVVLIDGYGLTQWTRDRPTHAFLDRLSDRATVTPLTSVYPSETAAALTTFHSGVLPAEHGVIGWNVYEPTIDQSFEALPFRTKAGNAPTGLSRADVADAEPLDPRFTAAGVDYRQVVPSDITPAGRTVHPYDDLDAFPGQLKTAIEAADPPAYVYAYLPQIDTVAHAHGTTATAYRTTLAAILDRLEAVFSGLDPGTAEDILLVVTADHGHVDTDPDRNIDLSTVSTLESHLRRHADGTPVRFAGSARNVHLHLESGAVDSVREALDPLIDGLILTKEEVLDSGLFGPTPSEMFRRRLGDLLVTHRDLGVWWGDAEPSTLAHVGMHGGLHPDEMLVPFAVVRLADLVSDG